MDTDNIVVDTIALDDDVVEAPIALDDGVVESPIALDDAVVEPTIALDDDVVEPTIALDDIVLEPPVKKGRKIKLKIKPALQIGKEVDLETAIIRTQPVSSRLPKKNPIIEICAHPTFYKGSGLSAFLLGTCS